MKISTDKLYCLCNKYLWFTGGDTGQYELLFEECRRGADLERLATIIYICSRGYCERDILEILKKETDL